MTRYRVHDTDPVGQGGFGKVKVGDDLILKRKVAVKTLNEVWESAGEEDKERFRREAETLAQLSHPHIPAIYDVETEDNRFEIIFQFVEGNNLRQILKEEQCVKLSECLIWFDQVASALGHAHEKGIIHRDVKPENIIVTLDRKHCYLVDFGIALSKSNGERLTPSDQWIGTAGYMSPAQQNGEELDGTDDLYVLGVCLYEALSGHSIEPGTYQPLNSINELIPPAVDELVRLCIERNKAARLKSAADFRKRLVAALSKHRALSELLSAGQLHEIVAAIAEMTPMQFMDLKVGQRLLILQKCQDLVKSTDRRLTAAREEMIEIMTPLGIRLPPDDYKNIVVPAIRFGFGPPIESTGTSPKCIRAINEAVITASTKATQPNHHVIVFSLLDWLRNVNLDAQPTWLYHSLRNLIASLMANPECEDDDAPELAKFLSRINDLQSSRHDADHDSDII